MSIRGVEEVGYIDLDVDSVASRKLSRRLRDDGRKNFESRAILISYLMEGEWI